MLRKAAFILFFTPLVSWANGFYLGAGVGPETADFYRSSTILVQTPAGIITTNAKDNAHLSGTGMFGTLFAGYAWSKQKFYLAGEVNANVSSLQAQTENQEYVNQTYSHTTFKMPRNFGLSLLPGYLYTPVTLFYLRLGYANGNFQISTTDTSLANINRNLSGLRYGLGVNQTFSQHIKARMEYSHIDYRSTSFVVVDGAATKATKISPQTNQVEFSLIYEFSS